MIFLLSAISGVLTALSMPGMLSGFLAWIALVPMLSKLGDERPLRAGFSTMLFFFVHLSLTHFWLIDTLMRNLPLVLRRYPPHLGLFVFLLFSAYESLFMFPLGFLVALFKPKYDTGSAVFTASLYVLLEKLREIGDLGFTGGRLSDALYSYTSMIQVSRVLGELCLVFLIVLVNSLIASYLKRKSLRYLITAMSIPILLGSVEVPGPVLRDPVSLQIHQTSYDPARKYSRSMHEKFEELNPASGVIFAVPEAHFTGRLDTVYGGLKRLAAERNSLLVVGALDLEGMHNSIYFFSPDGEVLRYDKVKLFPFVEFLPYPKLFSFLKFLKGLAYYNPGSGFTVADWRNVKVGAQICFESYFEFVSRELVRSGADILLVLTNDGWFKYDAALEQHFAKAVFRAVENGRWVVQIANKGLSGVVDEHGRIVSTIEIGVRNDITVPVQPQSEMTFYASHPNVFLWITFLALSVSVFFRIYRVP